MSLDKSGLSRAVLPTLAVLGWVAALAWGFSRLMAYEYTPAPPHPAANSWPSGSRLRRVEGVPNVLIAVHPRCPCTGPSLEVLRDILRASPPGASIRLLVFRPASASSAWVAPVLSNSPGVERVDDPGGVEAERFGLATSGEAIAFDAEGRERFSGGLNAGRGVAETSGGGRALLAILAGKEPTGGSAETFGCPIHRPADRAPSGGRR